MNTKTMVTSLLTAAAAGAVLGVLFAPDKGYKTRKKMMGKRNEMKDALRNKIDEFVDEIAEQYESAKDSTSKFFENGKNKYSNSKAEAKNV